MIKKGIIYLLLYSLLVPHFVYASGSWSAPQQLSSIKTTGNVRLAFNGSSQQVFAAWLGFPGNHPTYSTYSQSSGWSSAASITSQTTASDVNMVYDASTQQLFAVWDNSSGTTPTAAIFTPSIGWGNPTTISNSTRVGAGVSVGYDPITQQVFAAWSDSSSSFMPTSGIYTNGTWSTLSITDDLANIGDVNLINIGNTGDMMAGYCANNGARQPAFIIYTPQSQWSASFYLNSTVAHDINFVYDAQLDKVMAVWTDTNNHPIYSIFTLNVGWTTPTAITTSSQVSDVHLAYQSSTGIVFAAWDDLSTSYPMYATYTPSTGWSTPTPITTASQLSEGDVFLACDEMTQQIIAVWANNNEIPMYSIFGINAVSGLSVQQKVNNLGIAREQFNHLKWNSNPAIDNILGYYIYRNGILIATVKGHVTEYKDHNRKTNESVTYSVVAYNGQGQQSSNAYITLG